MSVDVLEKFKEKIRKHIFNVSSNERLFEVESCREKLCSNLPLNQPRKESSWQDFA